MIVQLTPRLAAAARALLGWTQHDLANRSGVPQSALDAWEAQPGGPEIARELNGVLVATLERAGVTFIREDGGGAGVRLRGPGDPTATLPIDQLNASNDE